MRPILTLLLLALLALPLIGCQTGKALVAEVGGAMPASSASVTELRTHTDSQDAALRAHVDAQDAAIRADVTAATQAGDAAFQQAIAAGKTQIEAHAAQIEAQMSTYARTAAESEGRAKSAADVAKEQAAKAAAESDGKTPWWATALGVVGTLVAGWLGLKKFDLGMFVGAHRAQNATEAEIVEATRRVLDGGAPPPKPAA